MAGWQGERGGGVQESGPTADKVQISRKTYLRGWGGSKVTVYSSQVETLAAAYFCHAQHSNTPVAVSQANTPNS